MATDKTTNDNLLQPNVRIRHQVGYSFPAVKSKRVQFQMQSTQTFVDNHLAWVVTIRHKLLFRSQTMLY